MLFFVRRLIFAMIALVLFTGCAKNFESGMRHSIEQEARKYIGVKYVYGGTTPKGFDCSGFVQYVYMRCGVSLPRTVGQMKEVLRKTNHPLKGDIVIFSNPAHVGIYIGKDNFIHASTSKGIMISNLKEKWFKERFLGFFTYF